jgi:hypothetical protein
VPVFELVGLGTARGHTDVGPVPGWAAPSISCMRASALRLRPARAATCQSCSTRAPGPRREGRARGPTGRAGAGPRDRRGEPSPGLGETIPGRVGGQDRTSRRPARVVRASGAAATDAFTSARCWHGINLRVGSRVTPAKAALGGRVRVPTNPLARAPLTAASGPWPPPAAACCPLCRWSRFVRRWPMAGGATGAGLLDMVRTYS